MNPIIPARAMDVAAERDAQTARARMPTSMRRLKRFVEDTLQPLGDNAVAQGLSLVIMQVETFRVIGGRLRHATDADVDTASEAVQGAFSDLLPLDDGLPDRVAASKPAQQWSLLHRAAQILWDQNVPDPDDKLMLSDKRRAVLLSVSWVALVVLDACWEADDEARKRCASIAAE